MEPDFYIEIYEGDRGMFSRPQWRARVKSGGNGKIIFSSSESYNNRKELVEICERLFPGLEVRHI